jgi:phage terminase small subunit
LTFRQERFCHAFVHWANGAVAAREAGYRVRSARTQASAMLQTGRIRKRIQEIQAQLAEDAASGMDTMIAKLEIVYRRAMEDHHFYAAARAVELQAKLVRAARPPASPLIEGTALPPSTERAEERANAKAAPLE